MQRNSTLQSLTVLTFTPGTADAIMKILKNNSSIASSDGILLSAAIMVEGNEVSIEFELRWHGHGIRMVS
mgnify:CR=1 FL=1